MQIWTSASLPPILMPLGTDGYYITNFKLTTRATAIDGTTKASKPRLCLNRRFLAEVTIVKKLATITTIERTLLC